MSAKWAMTDGAAGLSIPLLRADLNACSGLLANAVAEMHKHQSSEL